jgi:hypothetical protein
MRSRSCCAPERRGPWTAPGFEGSGSAMAGLSAIWALRPGRTCAPLVVCLVRTSRIDRIEPNRNAARAKSTSIRARNGAGAQSAQWHQVGFAPRGKDRAPAGLRALRGGRSALRRGPVAKCDDPLRPGLTPTLAKRGPPAGHARGSLFEPRAEGGRGCASRPSGSEGAAGMGTAHLPGGACALGCDATTAPSWGTR